MKSHPLPRFKSAKLSAGFSLVELMLAMTITLIVMTGVIQTMLDNKSKFILGDQLSLIQENARFAVEEMSRELRMAGYKGCSGSAAVANMIDGSAADNFFSGFGVEGWDSSEASAAFPDEFNTSLWSFSDLSKSDPDAFIIRRVSNDTSFSVVGHNSNSAEIDVDEVHGISSGEIMVVATPDCRQVSIFQVTGNNPRKFGHNIGGSVNPGNCIKKKMYGSFNCIDTATAQQMDLPSGSKVMKFEAGAYYIGPSSIDVSVPSLYRESIQNNSGVSSTVASELLIGVENMQILYGVDTSNDNQINRYVSADAISGITPWQWDNVVSVRLSLLLRSIDPVWGEDQTFVFDGQNYTDRFIRQRLTTTVVLRNLALDS